MKYTDENSERLKRFVEKTLKFHTGKKFTSIPEIELNKRYNIYRNISVIITISMMVVYFVLNNFQESRLLEFVQLSCILIASHTILIYAIYVSQTYGVKNLNTVLGIPVKMDEHIVYIVSEMYDDKNEAFVKTECTIREILMIFHAYTLYNRADDIILNVLKYEEW